MRAESGPDALETLKQLKLRGETVAVFVADYRMPQMSGIEFLEAAMDLYPAAKRVLLTAYADTHAAIDAINVVDLDHYLLKPWDPPEEKLYPVIDALLEAWRRAAERAIPHTKVIGHRWNARSWEVREFLARNRLDYKWFTADEPEGEQLLQAAGEDGKRLPVVITERGETLVEPTDAELADTLGLTTTPSQDFYDLVVVGGGPAGLAAAVYGASEGLHTVLIETHRHRRAGRPEFDDRELPRLPGRRLRQPARRPGAPAGREVRRRTDHRPHSRRPRGQRIRAHRPVRRRQLRRRARGHPRDRRRLQPAAGRRLPRPDRRGRPLRRRGAIAPECDGEEVYIVGGANSAGQAAMYLSRDAKSRDARRARAVAGVVDVALPDPADRAAAQHHRPHLHRGAVRHRQRPPGEAGPDRQPDRRHRRRRCARMFIFIGAEPRTDWLDGVLARDDHGFVLAGPDLRNVFGWTLDRPPHHLETSMPGVFVAGDVRAESAKRVAAAVGEGSMAVMLVHRYLAEA